MEKIMQKVSACDRWNGSTHISRQYGPSLRTRHRTVWSQATVMREQRWTRAEPWHSTANTSSLKLQEGTVRLNIPSDTDGTLGLVRLEPIVTSPSLMHELTDPLALTSFPGDCLLYRFHARPKLDCFWKEGRQCIQYANLTSSGERGVDT